MNTILLTGAIRPSFPVQRNDPLVRLTDYLCAIRRWLNVSTLSQIVYCDAGGCRIPEDVFGSERFESLTFDASDHARRFGAGRGEAESLAYMLKHSRFTFDAFFKCTGRHYVDNFECLQEEIRTHGENGLALRLWYVPYWADTRFFWVTRAVFHTHMEPRIRELTGERYKGHVLESLLFEYLDQATSFTEPEIVGYSGHLNFIYRSDFLQEEKEEALSLVEQYGLEYFVNESQLNG